MTVFFQFDHAESFVAAAVGQPGRRTFFLQIRSDEHRVVLKCEKQQVGAMAEHFRSLLTAVPAAQFRPAAQGRLVEPVEPAFVLGPIGLAFDPDTARFIVQLDEMLIDDEGDEGVEPGSVRVLLDAGQVEVFCDQVEELLASGRPTCPFCSGPIDPHGHPCPRMN
jgi:uncharacterized repeat protein (TIGR03847 family)